MEKNPYLHPDMSPEQLAAESARMNRMRWRGTTAQERSEFARQIAIHPGKPRCPCGAMTLKRAQARADKSGKGLGHKPECSFYRRRRLDGPKRIRQSGLTE